MNTKTLIFIAAGFLIIRHFQKENTVAITNQEHRAVLQASNGNPSSMLLSMERLERG